MDRHRKFKQYIDNTIENSKKSVENIIQEKEEFKKEALELANQLSSLPDVHENLKMHLMELRDRLVVCGDDPYIFESLSESLRNYLQDYYQYLRMLEQ